MSLSADLFWSFRSPYSYLATARYVELTKEYDLNINLRPVYPLAIREPNFFEKNHPNWLGYVLKDIARISEYYDIPLAFPKPDPIVQDMVTRKISDEQPYIFRLTRLGQVASRHGKSLEFCDVVSKMIWGGVEGWDQGDHLAKAAHSVGLDLEKLDQEALRDAEKLDSEIMENQKVLEAVGHWGVPTFVFNDEPFFGQDRIEMAVWRMKDAGLKAR